MLSPKSSSVLVPFLEAHYGARAKEDVTLCHSSDIGIKSFKSRKCYRRVVKKDFLRRTEKLVEELWHYVIGESKKKRVMVRQGSGLGGKVLFLPSYSHSI